jgi:signal transduction histidine kinase/ActR/RegA family two-component response regulator
LIADWLPDLGNPLVQEFSSDVLEQDRYVWGALEASDGLLYLAQDQLLHFDGAAWGGAGAPHWQVMRGITRDSIGNLWVASFNEIGYFELADLDLQSYISLRSLIPLEYRDFGQVWRLEYHDGAIWMATHTELFRWDGENFEVWQFPSSTQVVFHFTGAGIYYHKLGEGLYKFDSSGGSLFASADLIQQQSVMHLELLPSGNWICISVLGVFILDQRNGEIVNRHPISLLQGDSLSCVSRLENGWFALGTLRSGLIVLDEKLNTVLHWNESTGAPSNIVVGMYKDSAGGLFVFLSNKVVRLDFHKSAGIHQPNIHFPKGILRQFIISNNASYFGLDTGLYYNELHEFSSESKRKQLIDRPTNALTRAEDGVVLSSHFHDLYRWEGGELKGEIRLEREIRTLHPSQCFPGWVYVIHSNGISIVKWDRLEGWVPKGDFFSVPLATERVTEDAEGRLWLSSPGSHLLELEFEASGEIASLVEHREIDDMQVMSGNPIVNPWGNSILVLKGNRAMVWRKNSWENVPLPDEWPSDAKIGFATTDPGNPDQIWLYLETGQLESGQIWRLKRDSSEVVRSELFLHPGIEQLRPVRGLVVARRKSGEAILHLWGAGGVLNLAESVHDQISIPNQPRLTGWIIDGEYLNPEVTTSVRFDYREMSVQFASAGFHGARPYQYQTRLGNTDWGAPSFRTSRELGRLFEGHYSLEIRAIDANGQVSPTLTLSFAILPPWYRTFWAYSSYLIFFFVLIWMIIHYRESRLVKRKEELEAIVSQRTLELEKASRIKSDFIANMSHEIRNPLNGVIGLIGRLKANQPIPERHRNALNRAAHYLQATVEEVLDFSRIESGRINFESVVFDPVDTLQGVIEIYGERAAAKGLQLTFHSRNPLSLHVRSDPSKVQQIAGNLVGNAVKFTSKGSVHLGFSLEALSEDQGIMKFWVEDTGPGIPVEEQKLVFDKYYQSESMDNNLRKRGTGLGLSLCRDFVENMGGAIRLRSIVGKGSTFSISLPVVLEEPALSPLSGQENAETFERKVLIVEDLEYNRLYLEDVLKELGCRVESCPDGESGLDRALHGDWDLIFLDWDLPKISGLEIARRVRKSDKMNRGAVIVGMTAFATVETRNACLDAGMDHFLTKPLQEDKIVGVVFTVKPPGGDKPAPPPEPEVAWISLHALERLASMKNVPVEHEIARYLDIVDEIKAEIEKALAELDWDETGHCVHALLGHTGLISCAALTGVILDFQTVVHARDDSALEKEWQRVLTTIAELKQFMTNPTTLATAAK